MILNRELEVLYVGKASQGPIGGRLAHYFKYNPDRKTCRVVHAGPGGWSSPPIYVVGVAVPDELAFEAAALEEYLIRELQPSDNTLGVVLFAT
jgi:excinuclease UvrABC nuclease subunit